MASAFVQRLKTSLSNPAWVCFLWFGVTAGISLLATPVKFTAPSLTRAVALDVGRVVFTALNKAELIALVILLIVVRVSGRARHWWGVCGVLALIVLAQSVWLLPELAARAQMIAAGVEPPKSYLHAAYSSLELIKLSILFVTGMLALAGPAKSDLSG